MVTAGLRRRWLGPRRYPGGAQEICQQIVEACYHRQKRYFMTSPTTYAEFWARDFGRAAPALLGLGYQRHVEETYDYALRTYASQQHFSLVISPQGKLWDFPSYAPDGLAFFLDGLRVLDDSLLIRRYRTFLEQQIRRFFQRVIDPASGMVRPDKHFSEAQDYVIRHSSCYSNVMCYLVQQNASALGLHHPLAEYDYPALIVERFGQEDFFFDDLNYRPYVSADAAILPFWSGLLSFTPENQARWAKVLARLDAEGLNHPLPTRYGNCREKNRPMIFIERFNRWQRDAVWTCLGLHFLEVLQRWSPPRFTQELARYQQLIEKLHYFPEILDAKTGNLFRSPFYVADDSMLWAANLWQLLRQAEHEIPIRR
jgi:hypothetical protein